MSCKPDSLATPPILFKPSDIPAALMAKALSRERIISDTSSKIKASLPKVFTEAVKFSTAIAASTPAILEKTRAAFVAFKVSSNDKPCLANSDAAVAAISKLRPVALAS